MQWLAGLLLAVLVSYVAYRSGSLAPNGAAAAACLGTVVFGIGGWQSAVILLTFFITSSLLSQSIKGSQKSGTDRYAKGARRDAGQVLGNGGVAGLWIVAHGAFPASALPWLGFAGAIAAVTADTWATELGALSPTAPRLITHLRRVVLPGTSGAISTLGTLSGAVGAAAIAVLAVALLPIGRAATTLLIAGGGLAGTLFDSVLGASVQSLYYCPRERLETEQHPSHRCGATTVHVRGWSWLDNDWVNVACGALGSLVSVGIGLALGAS